MRLRAVIGVTYPADSLPPLRDPLLSASSPVRLPVDGRTAATMVVLCFCWGFTHVVAKMAAADISLVMQGGLRSLFAAVLLFGWTRIRAIRLFDRDGTLPAGLLAGALFAGEFVFVFAGLAYTGASRLVVFVYLAPVLTALGLHWLVPSERLNARQWFGVWIAFAGIVTAFADGFGSANGSLLGDAFGILAGILWAATTIVIRTTRLSAASGSKTLFYQLVVSGLSLPLISMLIGEAGVVAITPGVVASLAYQSIVVTFVTYLVWFSLLTRYLASRLSVFAFLTPLFGVATGVLILHEPLTLTFVCAVALVAIGIAFVNQTTPTTR